jgi:hypothetical protein
MDLIRLQRILSQNPAIHLFDLTCIGIQVLWKLQAIERPQKLLREVATNLSLSTGSKPAQCATMVSR